MQVAFGLEERPSAALPKHEPPLLEPGLGWREAHRRGQALMAEEAGQRGFEVRAERRLVYEPVRAAFRYQVQSSLDVSDRYASTAVWFDARDGHRLAFDAPTGQNAGRTLTTWLYQLHFGAVHGLGVPYRAFVCLMGMGVTALSVTGVWVWWVKREKRARKHPLAAAVTFRLQRGNNRLARRCAGRG
jgi:uncharacterized iron-regulated membrane protein